MSLSKEALNNRTTSSFDLSIGTSFALESLLSGPNPTYDPDRIKPPKIVLTSYNELWINLMTLFRNIVGAMDKEGFKVVMTEDIADVLEYEVELIKSVIKESFAGRVKVVFYTSSYEGLREKYPFAKIRGDSTDTQKIYTAILTNTLNVFFSRYGKTENIKHFNLKLEPQNRIKVLIITHFAYDLLSYKNFDHLDLLESHTGVLKARVSWNTKYADGKNLVRIPWSEKFLQVFGDSNTFYPLEKKIRQAVIDIAEKNNWNSLTTKDRIFLGIEQISDTEISTFLKQL